jgi:hypothetical protein
MRNQLSDLLNLIVYLNFRNENFLTCNLLLELTKMKLLKKLRLYS